MEQGCKAIADRIRRHWPEGPNGVWWRLVLVVLAAYAVTSIGLMQAPRYQASAQVWVDVQGTVKGKIQLIPLAPAPDTLRALTQTMVHAMDSRPVAEDTIQRLGLRMGPSELLDSLSAEQVEGTSFIVLTYEDTDPHRAQQIVNAVGQMASENISEGGNTLEANVYEKAALPTTPVSPRPARNGALALIVGLALAVVLPHGVPRSFASRAARIADGLAESSKVRVGQALATVRRGVVRTSLAARRRRPTPREVEAVKEQELLLALKRGPLSVVGVSMKTSLSIADAERLLQALAAQGHLEVTAEDGKLLYSFWKADGP